MQATAPTPIRKSARLDRGLLVHRQNHSVPIIEMDSAAGLARRIAGLDLRTDDVYYKGMLHKHSYLAEILRSTLSDRFHIRTYLNCPKAASALITREFIQLSQMHAALPENAVRPIALATYESAITGYFLEYVNAKLASDILADPTVSAAEKAALKRRISRVALKFHQLGLGHGDLNLAVNVFVMEDGRIRLYDPERRAGERNEHLIRGDRRNIRSNFASAFA